MGNIKKSNIIIGIEQWKREHKVFKEGIIDKGHVLGLLSMLEVPELSI